MQVYGNLSDSNGSRTTGYRELCASMSSAGVTKVPVYDEGAYVSMKSVANIKLALEPITGANVSLGQRLERPECLQVVDCMVQGVQPNGLWDLALATSKAIVWTRYQRGCFASLFMR